MYRQKSTLFTLVMLDIVLALDGQFRFCLHGNALPYRTGAEIDTESVASCRRTEVYSVHKVGPDLSGR